MAKLCPSAQPGMKQCRVLGVVQRDGPTSTLEYLNERVPATDEVLAMASPLKPTEVFRLAATCAEHKCPHFDGTDCQLATRIVQILPAVVTTCRRASYARSAAGIRRRAERPAAVVPRLRLSTMTYLLCRRTCRACR